MHLLLIADVPAGFFTRLLSLKRGKQSRSGSKKRTFCHSLADDSSSLLLLSKQAGTLREFGGLFCPSPLTLGSFH